MTLYLIPQLLLLMILIYVVTYVHIVTSDFHDIGHEKNQCRAALIHMHG